MGIFPLMKSKIKKNCIILLVCCIYLFSYRLKAFSINEIKSEILNVTGISENLLIEVAKKYPEVSIENIDRVVKIKLLNTTYHKQFKINPSIKENALSEITSLSDFNIEKLEDENNHTEMVIIKLSLKKDVKISPKILSKKQNVLTIGFIPNLPEPMPVSTPLSVTDLYNNALTAHEKNDYDTALNLYNEVLSKENNFYVARFNLAKLYADKQEYEKAISVLISIIKDSENIQQGDLNQRIFLLTKNMIGVLYYVTGANDAAIEEFKSIIKSNPHFYQSYYNLALVYEKKNDFRMAKLNLERAISLKLDFTEAYYHLGILSLITNDKKNAIVSFKKIIEIMPDSTYAELGKKEIEKIDSAETSGKN